MSEGGEYNRQNFPYKVHWNADENDSKWICCCGQSNNFPYCDGTHKSYNKIHGTDFKPLEVTKEENGKPQDKYICGCGLSKKRPFCDGSHKKIVFHSSLPYVVTVFALGYIWGTKLLAKQ